MAYTLDAYLRYLKIPHSVFYQRRRRSSIMNLDFRYHLTLMILKPDLEINNRGKQQPSNQSYYEFQLLSLFEVAPLRNRDICLHLFHICTLINIQDFSCDIE